MTSETNFNIPEKLNVQLIRSDISDEQAESIMFEVFDLLLKEDFTAPAGKEERPNKN